MNVDSLGTNKIVSPKHATYIPAIDGLRFFAFLFVFWGHIRYTFFGKEFNNSAWYGVEFFFLLSGFLLTRLLVAEYEANQKINIKKYFIRRILRIWPLYYSYLLLILCISVFWFHSLPDTSRFAGNIFFIDNLLSAFNGYNANLSSNHLWSISLEEQYYFVLPFFLIWLLKQTLKTVTRSILFLFALLVAGKLMAILLKLEHPFIYVLPVSGDCFLFGCIMGLGIYNTIFKKGNSWLLFSAGVLLLILVGFLPLRDVLSYNQFFLYLFLALGFGFILYAVALSEHKILKLVFENPVIVYLGKISFGLYIFHRIIIDKFAPILKSSGIASKVGIVLLIFIITVTVAILSYEFFEKRFLKLKERFEVVKSKEV